VISSVSVRRRSQFKMKELILNADDFALTRGVNEGILRAHRDGILTSTTLMANGSAFEDGVERARANPTLGVGCHLVLVGGPAVAPRDEIRSLADNDGFLPNSLGAFMARLSLGMIRPKHIERELTAQIAKIRAAGIEPTHLDTHKHTHVHPRVMEAVGRVARELGITRVRRPVEDLKDSWDSTRAEGLGFSMELVAAAIVRTIAPSFDAISRRLGLRSPDHFLGLALTGRLGPAALKRMIDTLPEGRTEIMLHPGVYDAELRQTDTRLHEQRQGEMEALLSPDVRRAVEEGGVRLISYRGLN
jgi:hopanoid biosynthesis associated protein HpnK